MKILDCYPSKGTFRPDEMVRLNVRIESQIVRDAVLRVRVWHLDKLLTSMEEPVSLDIGIQGYEQSFQAPADHPKGYGAVVELMDKNREVHSSASTAFDVLGDWTERPRYGFLTDFGEDRQDIRETADALMRYHINGLQFYDWQYRHDSLLPPTEKYIDPLGRELSLETVNEFIEVAHDRGMAAMPYLAVYAASLDFWEKHQDWGLYDASGKPITFEGFLGLMDPSPYSRWIDHLLDECDRLLANTAFDGLHVDQYGDPKEGFNVRGDKVDIPSSFHYFIWLLKKRYVGKSVTFNAVGNWPIDQLASAPQDFLYIEIWPSTPLYSDLLRIVQEGREKSFGKPVVIALYLPAEHQENIRLADALIMASGGTRIEIGENERLLTDPYFPNHAQIPDELRSKLGNYYDFLVRYGDLIGPQATNDAEIQIEVPDDVWVIPRKIPRWLAVNLVNFSGLGDVRWDEVHPAPVPQEGLSVSVVGLEVVTGVWIASPDSGNLALSEVDWSFELGTLRIHLPCLDYWTLLAIETD